MQQYDVSVRPAAQAASPTPRQPHAAESNSAVRHPAWTAPGPIAVSAA